MSVPSMPGAPSFAPRKLKRTYQATLRLALREIKPCRVLTVEEAQVLAGCPALGPINLALAVSHCFVEHPGSLLVISNDATGVTAALFDNGSHWLCHELEPEPLAVEAAGYPVGDSELIFRSRFLEAKAAPEVWLTPEEPNEVKQALLVARTSATVFLVRGVVPTPGEVRAALRKNQLPAVHTWVRRKTVAAPREVKPISLVEV